jgi:putative protease
MMIEKIKTPELLAPAGDLETALIAFESGADAVYAGLSRFNARERTQNFTETEYAKLITYARMHDKKVYLTLNTLIMDRELPDVANFLETMFELRPDAVIVQDFGILRMIRESFPELKIHASTQMAVHNSAGVNFLAEKGLNRVILERQVTLRELKNIRERSKIELEVFIHGALCCSLSGVCLFSSWMGGWSGNRGKCKQPCRRRYFSPDGNGFFFSTKDLYTLDLIPELMQLGIASLKIEGRLRKGDYVRPVVEAYRLMLDSPPSHAEKALKEARAVLSRASGREWSYGFVTPSAFGSVIDHTSIGSRGQWIGQVTESHRNGFYALCKHTLSVGDKIRIQPESGDEGPSLTITLMKEDNKTVHRSSKNKPVFIFCDKDIPLDGRIFRIGTSVKGASANPASIPDIRFRIELTGKLDLDGLHVKITDPVYDREFNIHGPVETAQKYPLTEDDLRSECEKLSADGIGLIALNIAIEGELFIQSRDLRKMRQNLAEQLTAFLQAQKGLRSRSFFQTLEPQTRNLHHSPVKTVYVTTGHHAPAGYRVSRDIDDPAPADERILPLFCPEPNLKNLEMQIQKHIRSGTRHFRVSSLYGFELLKKYQEVSIHSGFSIPAANSAALDEIASWGAQTILVWPELDRDGFEKILNKRGDKAELFTGGRLPVLITRAEIPAEGNIQDIRGGKFYVVKKDNLAFLYPHNFIKLIDFPGYNEFFHYSADLEQEGTTWNLDREWK